MKDVDVDFSRTADSSPTTLEPDTEAKEGKNSGLWCWAIMYVVSDSHEQVFEGSKVSSQVFEVTAFKPYFLSFKSHRSSSGLLHSPRSGEYYPFDTLLEPLWILIL